jgi:hypothetical protein
MPNAIQFKRKTTAGAPALGQLLVGEICLNTQENAIYWKKDAATIIGPITVTGGGDMNKLVYDSDDDGKVNAAVTADQLGGVAAALYAVLASPAFTGVPTAPTAAGGNNTTQIATTAFVKTALDNLIAGAPGALDTLNEFAAALGNDANFAATTAASLAGKLDANSTIDCGTIA